MCPEMGMLLVVLTGIIVAMKNRLSAERSPRCIACRRMLYLTPEGGCQNCRHMAMMEAVRERRRKRSEQDAETTGEREHQNS